MQPTMQRDSAPTRSRRWRPGGSHREFFGTVEARILVTGLALSLLSVIALGVGWLMDPGAASVFAAMTGLNLTIGRAAGMSFGYASGLPHLVVIASNILVETIQVLVIYPLFVLSWRNLVDVRHMRRALVGMRRSAEANQARVARYGMIGLFAFVFLPFWMTGPVVGSMIGFLIGLRTRQNLAIVLSATYVAVAIWALFFERMNEWLAAYGRYAAFGLVLVVAIAAMALRAAHFWRQSPDGNSEPRIPDRTPRSDPTPADYRED